MMNPFGDGSDQRAGRDSRGDETFIGDTGWQEEVPASDGKASVVALVERGGRVRPFHVANVRAETLGTMLARTYVGRPS